MHIDLQTVDTMHPMVEEITGRHYTRGHRKYEDMDHAWTKNRPKQVRASHPKVLARVSMGDFYSYQPVQLVGCNGMETDLNGAFNWWRDFFDGFADPRLIERDE
jgi:hypothetical protein